MSFVIGFVIVIILVITICLMISYYNMVRKKTKIEKSWLFIKHDLLIFGYLIQALLESDQLYFDGNQNWMIDIKSICAKLVHLEATDEIMNESRSLVGLADKIQNYSKCYPFINDNKEYLLLIEKLFEVKRNIYAYWDEYNTLVRDFNQSASKFINSLTMIVLGEGLLPYMDMKA